jgi:hypothetical protein
MRCNRLRPQLRSFYRLVRCHPAAHSVRSCTVRITLRRSRRIYRPEPSSVRHRQLHRTTRGRERGFRLPFHGAVCGILLGHALGCGRRFYRRANSNRPRNRRRQASCSPADRRSAFGGWRDAGKDKSMTCVTDAKDREMRATVHLLRALGAIAVLMLGACSSLSVPMNEPLRSAAGNTEFRLLDVNRLGGAESALVLVALSGASAPPLSVMACCAVCGTSMCVRRRKTARCSQR